MTYERPQLPQKRAESSVPRSMSQEAFERLQEISHVEIGNRIWFKNLKELLVFAEAVVNSRLCPEDYQGKPLDAALAIIYGLQLKLSPFMALQSVAVVNGRPSIWGDAALAVCRSHDKWVEEGFREELLYDSEGRVIGARCTVQRKGGEPITRTFTLEDAQRAGLLQKPGPWRQYPQRMLQMRARSWALRDAFGDALHGIGIAEETADIPTQEELETGETGRLPLAKRIEALAAKIRGEAGTQESLGQGQVGQAEEESPGKAPEMPGLETLF